MFCYLTRKTKCDSFLIKFISISMISFNVICRTYNCIVFSDFSLASHSLRHLYVVFFHSFVEWGGCSRGEGFYPLSLAPLKEVCLWSRTHKCGKVPFQPLNPSDGPNLPVVSLPGHLPWTQMTHDDVGLSHSKAAWPRLPSLWKAFDFFPNCQ